MGYFVTSLLFIYGAFAQEHDALKNSDVQKIMKQILEQHFGAREISSAIIKNSFKAYIDQFDPERLYLLEEEVRPYLQLSDVDVVQIIEQYKQNSFAEYAKLNKVIQQSIERARKYRQEVEVNGAQLFDASIKTGHEGWRDVEFRRLFAKTPAELKERIKIDLVEFIEAQKKHFGAQPIMRNQAKTLAVYEEEMRNFEDQYLSVGASGKSLSASESESLFVLHVLKALASSLDAHTKFFNNAEAYDLKVRLEKGFQGIGVTLVPGENGVVISGFIDNGPAAKSGLIKINDKIVKIDDVSLDNIPFEKIVELLRGKSGSSVALVVKRKIADGEQNGEKLFNIKLTREDIPLNEGRVSYTYENFGNGIIGKVTLPMFYQGVGGVSSEEDLRNAIKALNKVGPLRGLIIDMRENSGGFLSQAVKVGGLFITSGVIVISKYSTGEEHFYRDMDGKITYDGPLVILTSKETASAAEIVAQALQDYGVALIVGDEHTYGKGSIQSQTVTSDSGTSSFKVTVGKYYTVSGQTPQIRGVQADIVVPSQYANEQIGEEYLDYPLTQDKISAAYQDHLQDIETSLRPWYLKHYTPSIQSKKNTYKAMLPTLKKNSEYRIAHNKNYQAFLKKLKGESGNSEDSSSDAGEFMPVGSKKNYGAGDLQLMEATNIIKDIIQLQTQERMSVPKEALEGDFAPVENK